MNKKVIIGILLGLTLLVCMGIGILIFLIYGASDELSIEKEYIADTKITDECTEEAKELALVSSIEKKVSPNAVLIMKIKHLGCRTYN